MELYLDIINNFSLEIKSTNALLYESKFDIELFEFLFTQRKQGLKEL